MENNNEKMNVKGLVGMILGILALVLSFVPCLGAFAIYPGIVGLIFSLLGLKSVKKGMAIAGLICSILGTSVAAWQWYNLSKAAEELQKIDTTDLSKELDEM
ncbi:MAG: DUF4190 domain-containing protein [Crocinitomicaceae bacterium]|jgi:xanthosine utilization system XapX-like protein